MIANVAQLHDIIQKEGELVKEYFKRFSKILEQSRNKSWDLLIGPDSFNLNCALRLEFKVSNNATEYEVLLPGLRLKHEMKARKIQIYSDSQLVLTMRSLSCSKSRELKIGYADALSKLASCKNFDLMKAIPVKRLCQPTTDEALQ
ncbi:RNA-directed DNA polymerase [Abeliophyllum distichum]|uniref:RNA-directed DNA polymerase n=1 Tax=Abeliophyllum distichum TaxID=126358 RepID=A0ABD1RTS0_9LAMI